MPADHKVPRVKNLVDGEPSSLRRSDSSTNALVFSASDSLCIEQHTMDKNSQIGLLFLIYCVVYICSAWQSYMFAVYRIFYSWHFVISGQGVNTYYIFIVFKYKTYYILYSVQVFFTVFFLEKSTWQYFLINPLWP